MFDISKPEGDTERYAFRKLGTEAIERARLAESSVVVVRFGGLPAPGYTGPWSNIAVRGNGRWIGWKSGRPEAVPAAVAVRIDRILADPKLWNEPAKFPHSGCMDGGAMRIVVRHRGRVRVSEQDECRAAQGLSGELGFLVFSEGAKRTS